MSRLDRITKILDRKRREQNVSSGSFEGMTPSEIAGVDSNTMLPIPLPKVSQVNELISGRESPKDTLRNIATQETNKDIIQKLNPLTALPRGLRTIGTGSQYLESLISGPLLRGLEGKPEDMLDEVISAAKGEGKVQLGDLIRVTNLGGDKYNETLAKVGGFVAFAGLSNLATKGLITNGISKMWNGLKDGVAKHSKFYAQAADDFISGIDDVQSGLNNEFKNLYDKIGNKSLDVDSKVSVNSIIQELPDFLKNRVNRAYQALNKSKLINITRKGSKKSVDTLDDVDINKAKVIKDEISRYINKKVWSGIEQATPEQAKLMDDYFALNDAIAKNSGKYRDALLDLNKRYSEVHTMTKEFMPLLRKGSGATSTTIRHLTPKGVGGGLFKKGEGVAYQDEYNTMLDFSRKYFDNGLKILKDVNKYNNQITFTRGANAAGLALGAYGVNRLIKKPAKEFILDDGGSSTSEN